VKIKQFRYSADNLGYLIYGNRSAIVVDGGAVEQILCFARTNDLELVYVTNTHSHCDHTSGNRALLEQSGAEFLSTDALLAMGFVELDGDMLRVIHTPGHTEDSVCFYFDNVLVSGDTLFNGKIGRCFTEDFVSFFHSIGRLLELPGETVVYAGHDYVEEYIEFARQLDPENPFFDSYMANYDPAHVRATLELEKRIDPFLRFNDVEIVSILAGKGLPVDKEMDRWNSLISLM
jgi:hydroxyacylglutathione hydrolase